MRLDASGVGVRRVADIPKAHNLSRFLDVLGQPAHLQRLRAIFDALVKEGEGLSKKTRSVAEGKINEVTGNVSKAATQISSKAQAQATEAA